MRRLLLELRLLVVLTAWAMALLVTLDLLELFRVDETARVVLALVLGGSWSYTAADPLRRAFR